MIIVRPGTYFENIDFSGKAITLRSESGRDYTVIDGNQAGCVVKFSMNESSLTTLQGFTIRNGHGNANLGGGIFAHGVQLLPRMSRSVT